ncbi:phosphoheptose isomerase family protein [Cohnella rhizosphaerae]|uniref:SIS domain-containing protein n=1 Tax=Cohnella rhizosphaerae TaxID=1457232 RepID=A0A9X4KTW4_9BACL|nr:SIS domain-containing protein [Cohnella rhizosphaerae]MDG0810166.1 SIS domain-containing protein [Cohnella rhizosphaerae]
MSRTLEDLIARYPELAVCRADIERAYEAARSSFERGGKMLLAGNGGSAADCEHVVGELMKGFMSPRRLGEGEREKFAAWGEEGGVYSGQASGRAAGDLARQPVGAGDGLHQ